MQQQVVTVAQSTTTGTVRIREGIRGSHADRCDNVSPVAAGSQRASPTRVSDRSEGAEEVPRPDRLPPVQFPPRVT